MKKRILISGFQAFGGQTINPTAKLIAELQSGQSIQVPSSLEARSIVLPVTFAEAFDVLNGEIKSFHPDVILALGQAGGRATVDLERVAINCLDADIPDNGGFQPRDLKIEEQGREAYFSTLPLRQMLDELKSLGIPSQISNTAGTYVCNYLLYRVLEANLLTTRQCGFVHFPFLPEQAAAKPGAASMPFEQMCRALECLLGVCGPG